MKDNNKLMISEVAPEDYQEVIGLFNKNQVYQFSNKIPLTPLDLDLTMKIKEVTNLFLLKENNKLIGTIGFFKFITHGCLSAKLKRAAAFFTGCSPIFHVLRRTVCYNR